MNCQGAETPQGAFYAGKCKRVARVARVTFAGRIVRLCKDCDETYGKVIGDQVIAMCWKCSNVQTIPAGDGSHRVTGCREKVCPVTGLDSQYSIIG